MSSTLSEDVIVFNALSASITDINAVYNALRGFFELKKSIDSSDRYNFIHFEEDGPNYLEDFTSDSEIILNALKSLELNTGPSNVAGGIFTAITLIIEVFKFIPDKCYRLIILTDSGSIKVPTSYLLMLQDLIDKIYTLPFIIDIVRFNIDDSEEDKKLMSLAKRCNGFIHEINSMESLPEILEVLAIKHEVPSNSLAFKGYAKIPIFNHPFFEKTAENIIRIDQEEQCSICHKKGNEMVQCPSCLTIVHDKCYAMWAKKAHIGIIHIFRCHHCYYLLKLDQKFVLDVQSGKIPAEKDVIVKRVGFQAFLDKHNLKVQHVKDPMKVIVLKPETMTIPQNVAKKPQVRAKDRDLKVVMCQNCGKILTSVYKECPICHFPFF